MMQLQEYEHFRWVIMCGSRISEVVNSGYLVVLQERLVSVTFSVHLNNGRIRRSHQDNLRHRQKPDVPKVAISQDRTEASPPVLPRVEEQPEEVQVRPTTHVPPESGEALVSPERTDEARPSTKISAAATPSARKDYLSRIRKPPDRFEPEWN